MSKMFVSYWATFKHGDLSNSFHGNDEIHGCLIESLDDVRVIEKYIMAKLNKDIEEVAKVSSVTLTNWKSF